ncbi:hypothetical protein GEV33_002439 [Tenebrio molitor]|uniref:Uncharacterized protein n=1 Tax=Tenebrio molitor TaxID=7067 RepID=A0A8J6HTG9_TENMO|nr:hypothetical protein GEV33_002439 [Tenebrio molitor]
MWEFLSEEQTLRPFVPESEWHVRVIIDGIGYKGVWVFSRTLKEFPSNIVQEHPDGWKICFPMELRIPDEPGAIHHGGSDNLSVDCDFVLAGHLTSPTNQRIKLSPNDQNASFRILNLGEKAEKVVEFDTEVFYRSCLDSRRFTRCETMTPDSPQRSEDSSNLWKASRSHEMALVPPVTTFAPSLANSVRPAPEVGV